MSRIMLFLVAVVWVSACTDPFTIREPEAPKEGGLTFIPPRSPEVVLINLRNAILEQNLENYLRCLGDSTKLPQGYRFVADAGVASENQGVFVYWTKEDEKRYFSQLRALLPADSLHILDLRVVQTTQFADSALFVENYTLTVRHTQQDKGIPAIAMGQARYFMGVDAFGDWAIYRWEDQAVGDVPTWSVLKAIYGN